MLKCYGGQKAGQLFGLLPFGTAHQTSHCHSSPLLLGALTARCTIAAGALQAPQGRCRRRRVRVFSFSVHCLGNTPEQKR